jgi:hypothetical protein
LQRLFHGPPSFFDGTIPVLVTAQLGVSEADTPERLTHHLRGGRHALFVESELPLDRVSSYRSAYARHLHLKNDTTL